MNIRFTRSAVAPSNVVTGESSGLRPVFSQAECYRGLGRPWVAGRLVTDGPQTPVLRERRGGHLFNRLR
jgi:hypothetical protein